MSQQNVEFIRNLFDGAAAMDKETLLAALPDLIAQVADPTVEWIEDPTRADSRTYRGHEGVLASWRQWLDHWEDYGFEIERLIDCGDDVFGEAIERASGAASGAAVSSHLYLVVTVHDRKISCWREYYDKRMALEAAGLEE